MELFYFLIVSAVILTGILFVRKRKHPRYPPGPTGLPLLGNVYQLGKQPHLALRKWKIQYGNIFSLKLGLDDAVVINDPDLIRELFNESAASGRLKNEICMTLSGGNYGVLNTEGDQWKIQRNFVVRRLREMGFTKSSRQGMILEEAKSILEWFEENKDVPISTKWVFKAAVTNSLWGFISGERNSWINKDGIESKLMQSSTQFLDGIQQSQKSGLMFVPILKYIIPDLSGWTQLVEGTSSLHHICEESVARHKVTLDNNDPRDLIDHYLIEIGKTKDENSSFSKENGMKNLNAVAADVFVAGSETTSATMSWVMIYLSCHAIAQRKLIDEIRRIVGKTRLPSLSDRDNLPYTEAVTLEVLRITSLVALGGAHRMLEDKMFHGYFLPKHTLIISNIDSCLNDPQYWSDPEQFRPERFLSADETELVHNECLIPFSAGKRQCLGENLARNMIFLFTVSIFQKFEVMPDPEKPIPDLEPEGGFFNLPKPIRVVLKKLE